MSRHVPARDIVYIREIRVFRGYAQAGALPMVAVVQKGDENSRARSRKVVGVCAAFMH